MIACAVIAGGDDDDDDDLHMRSIVLDAVADAVSAGAVAITGLVFLLTDRLFWLDGAVALVIGVVIAHQALRLLRAVTHELRFPTASRQPKGQ
jgi:cobalt-zinc-cadmium efflux system protein